MLNNPELIVVKFNKNLNLHEQKIFVIGFVINDWVIIITLENYFEVMKITFDWHQRIMHCFPF